ncbi:MAG: YIP1 family protein, partial [Deltaproteobacteria bacterium]|nr:YIP1 family protein [Deltaproteobacteria bacterium]
MDENMEKNVKNILNTAMKVITNPVGFFRDMPKTGGFIEPLIFAVALGLVSGVITAILSIFSLGSVVSFWMGLAFIIYYPIMLAIGSFIGALILFIIWKIMGSQEPYETAYRCMAYAMAISPITVLLQIIPYIGAILGLAWYLYLMMAASTEVHKIAQKTALMVFGIIFILLALGTTCGNFTARKVQNSLEQYEDMTPEEAGKAFGEFMKGV